MTRFSSMVLFGVAAATIGCALENDGPNGRWAKSVAWLRSSADGHIGAGDLVAAESDLRRALALRVPVDTRGAGLLQDIDFALGSVLLASRRADEALAVAESGIRRTSAPTVFLANLHALRGMGLELTGQPLVAAEAYHAALVIHESLYSEALALGEDGSASP